MKKLLTVLFLFVSVIAFSQNNGINFQGVGRNSSGAVLASTKISLRFSVIQSSETGTVEYVESKEVTTNAQGIFSVVIGDGIQISKTGNFSDINWKINQYWTTCMGLKYRFLSNCINQKMILIGL